MSRGEPENGKARGRLLAAWEPPDGAEDPVGVIATTFTFEAGFFEEELLARFLAMQSSVDDGRAYLAEREERLGNAHAVVLADRRHVSRSRTLAWDLLPVPLPGGACQHAKVSVLAWRRKIRLIVGSANLTEPAYRRNLEGFVVFDFLDGGDVPLSVLDGFLDFIGRMIERVADPSESGPEPARDSPRFRAVSLLGSMRALARRLDLPAGWPRGEVQATPVFLEPDRGPGILEAMSGIWGGYARPREAWILSPFWSETKEQGKEPLVEDLAGRMSARGDLDLDLFGEGAEDASTGRWLVEIPESVVRTAERFPRLRVTIRPVSPRQEGETRQLHAKGIWWGRNGEREILLIGSSNASASGLGLGRNPRNFEANVAFLSNGDGKASRWFDAWFPSAPAVETDRVHLIGSQPKANEEGGPPPVPTFFRWAVLDRSRQGMELLIGFGQEGEPVDWRIAVEEGGTLLDKSGYQASRSPTAWRLALPGDPARTVPPTLLRVSWESSEGAFIGNLPINASNSESRSRPDLWQELDLETLLDLLASGGPIYRRLALILSRRERAKSDPLPVDLDPHRRVDTSNFLLQRIRRVSKALEGLRERLKAPILSDMSLEWRFHGPLSPIFLARKLLESVDDPEEQIFLIAEIALVVGNSAREATASGVDPTKITERYRSTIEDLVRMLPAEEGSQLVKGYLEKALTRARA